MLAVGLLMVTAAVAIQVGPAEEFKVVPDVIDKAPEAVLRVEFNSGVTANLGNELTPTQVKDLPALSWPADNGTYYTVAMIDPDARFFLHYLVGNVPGDDTSKGTTLDGYMGAAPPKEAGIHRYVLLTYKQPGLINFKQNPVSNRSIEGRGDFSVRKFVQEYGLEGPIAYNFYRAQYDDYVPIFYAQLNI